MRGLTTVGPVHDDAALHPANDRDQPFGFEDPQRLPQRRPRDAEALDEVGLVAERVALVQLAQNDEPSQLVGNLLGLLPWLRSGTTCRAVRGLGGH